MFDSEVYIVYILMSLTSHDDPVKEVPAPGLTWRAAQ